MTTPGKKIIVTAFIAGSALLNFQLAAAVPEMSKDSSEEKIFQQVYNLISAEKYKDVPALLSGPLAKGSPVAYYLMGMYHTRQQQLVQAKECFLKGAAKDEINCIFKLACMYSSGMGTSKDPARAFALFKKVAERTRHPEALFQMGRMLILGEGVPRNVEEAVKCLEKAAVPAKGKTPHITAQYFLGVYCKEEADKTADPKAKKKLFAQAYHYLDLAAENNTPGAWITLGSMYYNGDGLREKNVERAVLCYKAAAKTRDKEAAVTACYNLGVIACDKKEYDEALKWMKTAAAGGNSAAQKFVSEDYSKLKKEQKEEAKKKGSKVPAQAAESSSAPLALDRAVDSYQQHLAKKFNVDTEQKKGEEKDKNQGIAYVIFKLPPEIRMKEWTLDLKAVQKEIDCRFTVDRNGYASWMTEKFMLVPVEKNLLSHNAAIRRLGAVREKAVEDFLDGKKFRRLSEDETSAFYSKAKLSGTLANDFTNKIWQIRKNLYFNILCDRFAAWHTRSYTFFITDDKGDVTAKFSFTTPPDQEEAALIEGVIRQNPTALNLAAVTALRDIFALECDMTVDGKWAGRQKTIMELLNQSCKRGDPGAAFNLAQLYTEAKDAPKARQYLERCKELLKKKKGK